MERPWKLRAKSQWEHSGRSNAMREGLNSGNNGSRVERVHGRRDRGSWIHTMSLSRSIGMEAKGPMKAALDGLLERESHTRRDSRQA